MDGYSSHSPLLNHGCKIECLQIASNMAYISFKKQNKKKKKTNKENAKIQEK